MNSIADNRAPERRRPPGGKRVAVVVKRCYRLAGRSQDPLSVPRIAGGRRTGSANSPLSPGVAQLVRGASCFDALVSFNQGAKLLWARGKQAPARVLSPCQQGLAHHYLGDGSPDHSGARPATLEGNATH